MGYDLSTWDDVAIVRRSVARAASQYYAVLKQPALAPVEVWSLMVTEFSGQLDLLTAQRFPEGLALRLPLELALEWIRDQAIEA